MGESYIFSNTPKSKASYANSNMTINGKSEDLNNLWALLWVVIKSRAGGKNIFRRSNEKLMLQSLLSGGLAGIDVIFCF